ncbi:Transcriptional regulatory protein FixJ [compost metagenome]
MFRRHRDEIGAVLVDLSAPERAGNGFLRALGDLHASVPVIVQTSEGATHHAVEAMRAGIRTRVDMAWLRLSRNGVEKCQKVSLEAPL